MGEEALWSLLDTHANDEPGTPRRLSIVARPGNNVVELEFFSSLEGENLQDRLAFMSGDAPQENEASFRLLTHYAQSVRHQKYHGVDIVRVRWRRSLGGEWGSASEGCVSPGTGCEAVLTRLGPSHTINGAVRVFPQRAVCLMGISLAVGHLTLDQAAEVRILHPQPSSSFIRAHLRSLPFANTRVHFKPCYFAALNNMPVCCVGLTEAWA